MYGSFLTQPSIYPGLGLLALGGHMDVPLAQIVHENPTELKKLRQLIVKRVIIRKQ